MFSAECVAPGCKIKMLPSREYPAARAAPIPDRTSVDADEQTLSKTLSKDFWTLRPHHHVRGMIHPSL